ncbi:hypothetical protein Nepgr_030324 [Nepenthes gracilis]|uniref:non-specific serine/threonine protein kinase n=1 Tax=Nepenthes gracilis TaxID=150966 RepID=A0AAD3TG04_NEPGR|nr:hypothetical protein Nepgr_030324 [Nepenthes gracilis]
MCINYKEEKQDKTMENMNFFCKKYNEILGKGASKTVYRAFDEYEGIEVAWNQVKLTDFLQRPEDLERLYSEIHLLKTLKHKNIMKFYTSWIDATRKNINFVTEMFTSGTLRQYRLKHKKINLRAVKHWCRQILEGLLYLHSHDPPVIHRDLKCDNIFINGNQGEVKIGDLGLAAILFKSYAAHCVGTPEFMAPEVYAEQYNELVDIYSFGMCVLEMVTFEYPYSECTHPAQIYKKVISGKKPNALYRVTDPEVRQFVEKCLATLSRRLPASELLKDTFLQIDNIGFDSRPSTDECDFHKIFPFVRVPVDDANHSYSLTNAYPNHICYEPDENLDHKDLKFGASETGLFTYVKEEYLTNVVISIMGKRRGDGDVFLRLRIADKEGRVRNIYFLFDIETDTAVSVATEMVAELDITDEDATKIAEMIDRELASLVPNWNRVLTVQEASKHNNCASNDYLEDYVSSDNPTSQCLEVLHGLGAGCSDTHGRFEEITYQVGVSEQSVTDGMQYADIRAQHDGPYSSSQGSTSICFDGGRESFDQREWKMDESPLTPYNSPAGSVTHDHENDIRKELRWLKVKYQTQLRGFTEQKLGDKGRVS